MGESTRQSVGGGATRRDEQLGIREEAEFFGAGADRLFGIRYLPETSPPVGAVVICEPLMLQFIAHYRYGTLLARSLAAAGLAVQRFHYRGTHNSDGAITDLSLETMYEDTLEAATALNASTGVPGAAYIGVQIGAFVAARASSDGSPLVLDSPPPDGRLYLRDLFRSHAVVMMQSGMDSETATPTRAELLDRMRSNDDLVLLGCRFPASLHDSLEGRTLSEEAGATPRPVLVIGGSHQGALKPEAKRVQDELADNGLTVDHVLRPSGDPFLYVEHSAPEDQVEVRQTNEHLAGWLSRHMIVSGVAGDE